MRRTKADDSRTLPFPPERVWAALTDFENDPKWWPADLRLRVLRVTDELVGSCFEIRPRGGSFVSEVEKVDHGREMLIRYVAGVHRGTGLWTLVPAEGGTLVRYAVDLEPQDWLIQLLSRLIDFDKVHSRAVQKLFDGLEGHIGRHGSRTL